MKKTLESRITMFCNRNGLEAPLKENLEFGYTRMRVDARSWGEYDAVRLRLRRLKNVVVEREWTCGDGGYFEGAVWVMDAGDYTAYKAKRKEKEAYLEDWWQRYHVADAETRRLMGCGKIL